MNSSPTMHERPALVALPGAAAIAPLAELDRIAHIAGRALRAPDAAIELDVSVEQARVRAAAHGRSCTAQPIHLGAGRTAGVIWVTAEPERAWTRDEVELLAGLAELAADAIELRAAADAGAAGGVDELTGLPNRHRMLEAMDGALAASSRETLVLAVFDVTGLREYTRCHGHGDGDDLLRRLARRLAGAFATDGSAYRLDLAEFCVIARGIRPEDVLLRARGVLRETRGEVAVEACGGAARARRDGHTATQLLSTADARLQDALRLRGAASGESVLSTLLETLTRSSGDPPPRRRVAELAVETARSLGAVTSELQVIRAAAELHEIGRDIGPDVVLDDAPRGDGGWDLAQCETTIGRYILEACPQLAPVGAIVRAATECFDGSGYPQGVKGERIPLAARVIAVCDAYDALTVQRPHAAAIAPARALDQLERGAGRRFDPAVVKAFRAVAAPPRAPAVDFTQVR